MVSFPPCDSPRQVVVITRLGPYYVFWSLLLPRSSFRFSSVNTSVRTLDQKSKKSGNEQNPENRSEQQLLNSSRSRQAPAPSSIHDL